MFLADLGELRHCRGEELAQRLGDHRAGEEEALRIVAAEFLESRFLRGSLDAFGDAGKTEQMREADDRRCEFALLVVGVDAVDELFVDLRKSIGRRRR